MATTGALKGRILQIAGVDPNGPYRHSNMTHLSQAHKEFWEWINEIEMRRGYDHEKYLKPDSPCLRDMELLSEEEFEALVGMFELIHERWKQGGAVNIH